MNRFVSFVLLYLQLCVSCNPQAFAAGPFIWGADNRAQGLQSSGAVFSNGQPVDYNGPINRIGNNEAIVNTDGWTTYADAAATSPVDCTGGSPNITWTRNTSSPLRGNSDFLETKDAANRQGEGVAYAFTIDSADTNKTLNISFNVSPSANFTAGDNAIFIYDVTNAALITPASNSVAATAYGFQTSFAATSSTSYRLCVHVASTNASAYTVQYDNFFVGPQQTVAGSPSQDWISWTPTGTFTNVTYTGRYKRIGDTMMAQVNLTVNSAPGAATLLINMPTGLTVDTSKLVISSTDRLVLGFASFDGNGARRYQGVTSFNSPQIGVYFLDDTTGAVDRTPVTNSNLPFSLAANDKITINFTVPVAEWSGSSAYLNQSYPEYASNSGTWDAADTTSFAYGAGGTLMGGSLTSSRAKRVRFLTNIQAQDKIEVQGSYDRVSWFPINGSSLNAVITIPSVDSTGAIFSGVSWDRVSGSTTDVDITFGRYQNIANDDSPATNWPSTNAYWRVVKIPGLVQVANPTSVKYQRKVNSANASGTGTITDLGFSNLIVGNTYRLSGQIQTSEVNSTANEKYINWKITNNGVSLVDVSSYSHTGSSLITRNEQSSPVNVIFVAAASTIVTTVVTNVNMLLNGNNFATNCSFLILEELPSHTAVTTW